VSAGIVMMRGLLQPVSWASFGFVVVAGGAVVLYVRSLKKEKEECECLIWQP
jgi:hypothetical protein